MLRRGPLWRTGIALSVVFLVTACGSPQSRTGASGIPSRPTTSARTTTIIDPALDSVSGPTTSAGRITIVDQAGPPPIVLADSSPGNLAVSVYLMAGGYDAASRNISELAIGFSAQGHPVQFVGSETVICNGAVLPRGGGTFDTKLPTENLAGKQLTCTYKASTHTASFTFTAPPALSIVSPLEQATVARSSRTLIRFQVGGNSTMFYVIALGANQKAWTYPVGSTPTQATVDTSAFSPGRGSITLSQSFTLSDLHGTGFASVDGHGDAVQQNAVTWA